MQINRRHIAIVLGGLLASSTAMAETKNLFGDKLEPGDQVRVIIGYGLLGTPGSGGDYHGVHIYPGKDKNGGTHWDADGDGWANGYRAKGASGYTPR